MAPSRQQKNERLAGSDESNDDSEDHDDDDGNDGSDVGVVVGGKKNWRSVIHEIRCDLLKSPAFCALIGPSGVTAPPIGSAKGASYLGARAAARTSRAARSSPRSHPDQSP